jgi:hypothetical protein
MESTIIEVKRGHLRLANGVEINVSGFKAKIASYLEFPDRVIIRTWTAVDTEKEEAGYNLCRNIFCYSKEDGHLIWQVEQAYGRDHQPLEAVYKYINLKVRKADGSYDYAHESIQHESGIWGKIYLKPFRHGVDKLEAMTLADYPSEYWIDYETGKVEWFAIHQKV